MTFSHVIPCRMLLEELRLVPLQVGADVHYILLWPLGGLAFVGHSSSPGRDLFVAVMGPLMHLPQLALWVAILALSAHVVHYPWHSSLHLPDIRSHFWLAVCVGAAWVGHSLVSCSETSIECLSAASCMMKQHHHVQHMYASERLCIT